MSPRRPVAGETGSATMWLMPMVAILGAVTLVLGHVGAAVVALRRTEAGADLSALAGASALQRGGNACAAAAGIADRNGVELVGCAVAGLRITVRVRTDLEVPVLGAVSVSGRARAGPAHATPVPADRSR